MYTVWRRFEKTMKDGTVKKFRVQTVPENMYDELVTFMNDHFSLYEPFSIASGFSLICLEEPKDGESLETKPKIVGANFLLLAQKGVSSTSSEVENQEPEDLQRILDEVASHFNVFEKFGVDVYMDAAGMCVSKEYKGLNIAVEIMLARTPLCEANGIKVTKTIFSAIGSQVLALKAGFTSHVELQYEYLEEKLNLKFPSEHKSLKIMTKTF